MPVFVRAEGRGGRREGGGLNKGKKLKKCCALPEERLNKVTETAIQTTADARTPTKIDVTDSEMNRS